MIEPIEDMDYISSTNSQVIETLKKACGENNGALRARYYIKTVSLLEALPESAFENGDIISSLHKALPQSAICGDGSIRGIMGDLYGNAFNNLLVGRDYNKIMMSSPTSYIDYYATCYYGMTAEEAKDAIDIAERAKKKLELILCDEIALQRLRNVIIIKQERRLTQIEEEKSEPHVVEIKSEDDALFYSNYGEWKRQNK